MKTYWLDKIFGVLILLGLLAALLFLTGCRVPEGTSVDHSLDPIATQVAPEPTATATAVPTATATATPISTQPGAIMPTPTNTPTPAPWYNVYSMPRLSLIGNGAIEIEVEIEPTLHGEGQYETARDARAAVMPNLNEIWDACFTGDVRAEGFGHRSQSDEQVYLYINGRDGVLSDDCVQTYEELFGEGVMHSPSQGFLRDAHNLPTWDGFVFSASGKLLGQFKGELTEQTSSSTCFSLFPDDPAKFVVTLDELRYLETETGWPINTFTEPYPDLCGSANLSTVPQPTWLNVRNLAHGSETTDEIYVTSNGRIEYGELDFSIHVDRELCSLFPGLNWDDDEFLIALGGQNANYEAWAILPKGALILINGDLDYSQHPASGQQIYMQVREDGSYRFLEPRTKIYNLDVASVSAEGDGLQNIAERQYTRQGVWFAVNGEVEFAPAGYYFDLTE